MGVDLSFSMFTLFFSRFLSVFSTEKQVIISKRDFPEIKYKDFFKRKDILVSLICYSTLHINFSIKCDTATVFKIFLQTMSFCNYVQILFFFFLSTMTGNSISFNVTLTGIEE